MPPVGPERRQPADLYPSISLLGSVGLSATSLGSSTRVADLGHRPEPGLERVRPRPAHEHVLVQDARFQQLYEQYQDAVLRGAREVDDAAVGFAKTASRSCCSRIREGGAALARHRHLQYREGLTDFQRVLDSQRSLFSQQELLVSSQGRLTQNLIALYKAMGGGWEQGRSRPVLDDATRETMSQRSDWKGLRRNRCLRARHRGSTDEHACRSGKTMSAETPKPDPVPDPASETSPPAPPAGTVATARSAATATGSSPPPPAAGKGLPHRRAGRAGPDRRQPWPGTSSPIA
jgi:hypothetical protein